MACGYSSWCSSSVATGMICSSTNSRTSLTSSVCSSVRPSVCCSRDMLGSPPCVWALGQLRPSMPSPPGERSAARACEGRHLCRRSPAGGRRSSQRLPGLPEPDLLALDRALERRTLAEVAVLETDRDGAQQVGARRGRLVLERLEEEVGERAVRAAPERRVRGGLVRTCTRRTARASTRSTRLLVSSTSALRSTVGRSARRSRIARVWSRPLRVGGGRNRGFRPRSWACMISSRSFRPVPLWHVSSSTSSSTPAGTRAKRSCSSSSTMTVSRSHWSPF